MATAEAAPEADNGRVAPAARAARGRVAQPATARAASGATKQAVLAALASGDAMTAGQVAEKAGLARPTVSTTLTKLAKSGEVTKAARGYQIAAPAPAGSAGEAGELETAAK